MIWEVVGKFWAGFRRYYGALLGVNETIKQRYE